MFTLSVPSTGKELRLSERKAKEVFGATDTKKFLCLPCAGDVKMEEAPGTVQVIVKKSPNPIKKRKLPGTCVIRMGGIGDLIMLSSGLRELKRRNAKEPLTMATLEQHVPFMKGLGFLDRCIPISALDRFVFDKLIDLRFAVEPPQLGQACRGTWEDYTTKDRSDVFDELLGVYPCPKRFQFPVDVAALKKMRTATKTLDFGFILLNCSMVAAARSIIPRYVKPICSMIRKMGLNVVLCGASQPWNEPLKEISGDGIVNLVDKTTLEELIALVSMANLVVTPDTGTLHIAGALGKWTLGLFGNINPRTRISYYPTVRPLYRHGELPCQPCWDLHKCMEQPEKGSKCMALLKPSAIFEAIKQLC